MKLQLSKEMVSRLTANRPDSQERDNVKQASKLLEYKGRKLDLAQRQLMLEVERAVQKRQTLGTKVVHLKILFINNHVKANICFQEFYICVSRVLYLCNVKLSVFHNEIRGSNQE